MATASPTPAGADLWQSDSLLRKPSLRSSTRRAIPRPQVNRADLKPAPNAYALRPKAEMHSQLAGDSSDEDIPVPKASALTNEILNRGGDAAARDYGRVRTRAQSHRPSSPPAQPEQPKPMKRRSVLTASVASIDQDKRQTRAASARPSSRQSSRPSSPARSHTSKDASPVRKRVVRLSSTSQGSAASSASQYKPAKRRSTSTSLSASQIRNGPPSVDGSVEEKANNSEVREKEINTPGQHGRVVRIATGSGNRGRSTGSSAVSSKRADSASRGVDNDLPDEPQTAGRHQRDVSFESVSRRNSNPSRVRNEENPAPQSSMRVKRVGKLPGSFLSGPARRGGRRQSEEDAEAENDLLRYNQDVDDQQPNDLIDLEPVDNPVPSYLAPDRIASGSPVSAKSSARAGLYRRSPVQDAEEQRRLDRNSPDTDGGDIIIPRYTLPPPRSDILPTRNDQENEAPPTFRREKPAGSLLLEKDFVKPVVRPISTNANALRPASPERKALGSLPNNTPRRAVPPPPPKMSILNAATATAGAATTSQGAGRRRNYMKVNGKAYTRIDCLGRGGSGKVYRVAADNGSMYALKRVSIENADENTVKGYKGEIDLLKKLNKVERVITLFDYEMNDDKQVLSLLMEMGEIDLHKLLSQAMSAENAKFNPVFVRYIWQEMLECLASVHAHDIVHSDLKPANFVLKQGRLKLIDFGIANAIQTDETVNVHRETQIGTPNYMSPESLIDSNTTGADGRRINTGGSYHPAQAKLMKLGKPSDIWSLGCILYQMVYGQPPFGHIANQIGRCHAIIDWRHEIAFPERGMGGVRVPASLLETLRNCLDRDLRNRPTCEELLAPSDRFLYPVEMTKERLGSFMLSFAKLCRDRGSVPSDAEVFNLLAPKYWEKLVEMNGGEAGPVDARR
ncbi:kinase-like domain-containing protein [Astrocystis sublimbata]|nr:kinase-like domain-containing protein [Astrocystis sublimbata]